MDKQRRNLLKAGCTVPASGLLLGLSGCSDTGQNVETQETPYDAAITVDTLLEAEKLTGVDFTETERQQMLHSIQEQVSMAQAIRDLPYGNDEFAPAQVFNPVLPGMQIPENHWDPVSAGHIADLPASEADIAYAPITLLSEWIRQQKITSTDLTNIYLSRIERYANQLDCIITVTKDLALEQASRADQEIAQGKYRGPLHGIPYGVKDLFDTKDILTTWGATPFKDRVAEKDATIVQLLEEAGAVLIAKTSLGALAYGDLWYDGLTRNPWNIEEGSGGSSAGSGASVAAGLMGFAIGTETLGSIENPASRNGVAGLRPTFGRVSRYGAMVLCWSMDKVGPMCRSVDDTMLVLNELNHYDSQDPGSIDVPLHYDKSESTQGLRIGYMAEWFNREHTTDVIRAIPETIRDLGFTPVEIDIPTLPYDAMISILMVEAAAALEELTLTNQDDLLRGQTDMAWPNGIRKARFIPAVDLIRADRLRRQTMEIVRNIFTDVDAVIGPSIATRGEGTIMSLLTNFTGQPAVTFKAGFKESEARRSNLVDPVYYGSPASGQKKQIPACVTIWGPMFEEGKICRIASVFENNAGVNNHYPPEYYD